MPFLLRLQEPMIAHCRKVWYHQANTKSIPGNPAAKNRPGKLVFLQSHTMRLERNMKKFRRYLPLILLLLALVILLYPSRPADPGNLSQPVPQNGLSPVSDGSGSLQLLEPSPTLQADPDTPEPEGVAAPDETPIPEDGSYTTKEDVTRYLITYGRLPDNFVTKAEAEKAGWNGGSLEQVMPGKCIGGNRFGNLEGLLPKAKGRTWWECDINTLGKRSRGAERLVYSNDGLIYYTDDHYESFSLLYGEP